ncbi:LysR family transcriptional regulator [uncultured Polaribacter sp.]|uniref:LysR family transcriptional regulator n=1 Tax=uncultured Polaribacter sp. TaxID=174711 RepID=UPI0026068123|nr:LysR family transcriptional regulator [uncultured Polaribacter sp.]
MNFTLHQLKVFTTIVENSSITKAAVELNMTQPAASIQLKNFQDQFDISLSEVVGRQFYVTDFGKEIYQIAYDILNKTEEIQYKTEAFKGLLSGKLKISVVSTGNYVMPFFLNGFLKQHPNVELVMDVSNKTQVIRDLEQNLVDFSLVTVSPSHLDLKEHPIMENQLVLVASKDNQLTDKEKRDSIFNSIPLIYREEGSGTRHTMQQFFRKAKISPKIKLELTSNEAIKQAVIADIGVSIVSLLSIKNELLQNELKVIPVQGLPLKSQWKLIYLKKKKLSPVAKAFLEYVESEKETVFNNYFNWLKNVVISS